MTGVFVVMSELAADDDGDYDRELVAVHETPGGAAVTMVQPADRDGMKGGTRRRYVVPMELQS